MSPSIKRTADTTTTTTTATTTTTTTTTTAATVANNECDDGNHADVTSEPNDVIVAPSNAAAVVVGDNHVTRTQSTTCRWRRLRIRSGEMSNDAVRTALKIRQMDLRAGRIRAAWGNNRAASRMDALEQQHSVTWRPFFFSFPVVFSSFRHFFHLIFTFSPLSRYFATEFGQRSNGVMQSNYNAAFFGPFRQK